MYSLIELRRTAGDARKQVQAWKAGSSPFRGNEALEMLDVLVTATEKAAAGTMEELQLIRTQIEQLQKRLATLEAA